MHLPDFLFPRFLVLPPANPVFLSGFPFRCTFNKWSSIEVQDEKTGKMRRHAGLIN